MEQELLNIQEDLKRRIELSDQLDLKAIRTVAGVDLAYWNDENGEENAVCCIVVIDYITHEVVEKKSFSGKIEFPYIPGFLAFRELPLVLKTAELLENSPDVYMFDGNGYLHPRHMGIATHASFSLNAPTIGVAKTYFRVDRVTNYTEPEESAGSYTDIVIGGEVYGRALRTHDGIKPVFVSVGNHLTLETAMEITLQLVEKESHIPIPTRLADLETHIKRTEIKSME